MRRKGLIFLPFLDNAFYWKIKHIVCGSKKTVWKNWEGRNTTISENTIDIK